MNVTKRISKRIFHIMIFRAEPRDVSSVALVCKGIFVTWLNNGINRIVVLRLILPGRVGIFRRSIRVTALVF